MTLYRVTAERSGDWSVLQAVDVPGAITQVRTLNQAEQVKEAIAFVPGVSESDVLIELARPYRVKATREGGSGFCRCRRSTGSLGRGEIRHMAQDYSSLVVDVPYESVKAEIHRPNRRRARA